MEEIVTGPGLNVNLLLCDAAQSVKGKLFVLGGGLARIGPNPQPLALALHIEVPWDQADHRFAWTVRLLDEDGRAVIVGDKAVEIAGTFVARRTDGVAPGAPLSVALAITISPLPLPPGRSYMFGLEVDGESLPNWRVRFAVAPRS